MKWLTSLDLNKNELQNARVQNLASAPSSPVVGQFYYDTGTDKLGVYTSGSTWVYLGSGTGTVTTVSVASANGFGGSVSNATSTPAITVTTSVTGLLKGDGTGVSAAAAGADYLAPTGDGSGLTGLNASALASGTVPNARIDSSYWATKSYVDTAVQGLTPKPTARAATTAALPACTYANGTSGVGATLTGNANGALTVDSYAVAAGDRVLVKNQASGLQNGLYDVTQAGDGSHPFILTRNADMDTAAEFQGAFVVVEDAGTANANSLWVCTNSADPTVGTTAVVFAQLNGATQLSAGTGVTISGNTVSISTGYVGQTSITTLGTVGTGTWQGTAVAVGYGGTGAGTAAGARSNLNAAGVYSATIGDGSSTSVTVTQGTHGLASNGKLIVQTFDASTGAQVYCDVTVNNSNGSVTFGFASAPSTNAIRVVILG